MGRRSVWEVRAEVVAGAACLVLALITLVWQEWIEAIFRVDPDHGNGSLEWAVVGILLVATVVIWARARVVWRRGLVAGGSEAG
jgi:hypothetical protein